MNDRIIQKILRRKLKGSRKGEKINFFKLNHITKEKNKIR